MILEKLVNKIEELPQEKRTSLYYTLALNNIRTVTPEQEQETKREVMREYNLSHQEYVYLQEHVTLRTEEYRNINTITKYVTHTLKQR